MSDTYTIDIKNKTTLHYCMICDKNDPKQTIVKDYIVEERNEYFARNKALDKFKEVAKYTPNLKKMNIDPIVNSFELDGGELIEGIEFLKFTFGL